MIRNGDKKSIPMLKKLWKECFSDTDAYIDAFFAALYEEENVLLAEENGMLFGASFFLRGKIYLSHGRNSQGTWQDIRYVYALAVFPQYRGRGIAGDLLLRAFETYRAPLIAQPAETGLVDGFYEPLGFSRAFYLKKERIEMPHYSVRAAEIRPVGQCPSIRLADAENYNRIREQHFQKHGFVHWPVRHVAFAIQEHRANGGDALLVSANGREDLLLYYMEGGHAVVTETTLPAKQAAEILWEWLPTLQGSIRVATETAQTDGAMLKGVLFGMSAACGYLNLSLD